jgi:hypothetical protein
MPPVSLERLREIEQAYGQKRLAIKLGVNPRTIRRWHERGIPARRAAQLAGFDEFRRGLWGKQTLDWKLKEPTEEKKRGGLRKGEWIKFIEDGRVTPGIEEVRELLEKAVTSRLAWTKLVSVSVKYHMISREGFIVSGFYRTPIRDDLGEFMHGEEAINYLMVNLDRFEASPVDEAWVSGAQLYEFVLLEESAAVA